MGQDGHITVGGSGCPRKILSIKDFISCILTHMYAPIYGGNTFIYPMRRKTNKDEHSKYITIIMESMLLRAIVYGNPGAFLVGILRIPAYHVDYTTVVDESETLNVLYTCRKNASKNPNSTGISHMS